MEGKIEVDKLHKLNKQIRKEEKERATEPPAVASQPVRPLGASTGLAASDLTNFLGRSDP